ncbi:ATP-binding cassette domain-containing protein [Alteromonas sp. ASW11-19]|uniref:ATP-binding cassette domain-containing protein n=1 Tax=Alteromonas salexigens TaxID=2982530 RepID=A0ABT2VLW2_9ALTE|nr:ATP-binding cassette domain-containing protein [Alteromonas salexigens]MCU7553256.1 ATP-binding cassette domain-containing protein [Alteromonas salexigens]
MTLALNNLTIYRHGEPLLSIDVTVPPGQVVAVMGPSGAGKSTLLDAICGQLSDPFSYSGDIILNDQRMNTVAAHRRNMGILYQDALLFEHMTVGENIAFALPRHVHAKTTAAERHEQIAEQLSSVGLADLQDRAVQTLSGGQQARVALLRTLAAQPAAVLLDEPFARLDAARKDQLRHWVFDTIVQRGLPALMVTHDPNDAQAAGGPVIEV